ncbi:hypothetical protein ORD22_02640 [Sporosarcina sp. GW1-11]|uniref:hypothetical protein n=1 Tax=Sporosarcina sp. GW1-11 TaxID=2899126 RepID=UPI00294DF49C|nr:hypothetical protein [Sporosarcina sp. GW1-11]MDV6377159.1 hypothetical protein [Sporosarcina sp. GW1-11]
MESGYTSQARQQTMSPELYAAKITLFRAAIALRELENPDPLNAQQQEDVSCILSSNSSQYPKNNPHPCQYSAQTRVH